jgi:hypothetical protein
MTLAEGNACDGMRRSFKTFVFTRRFQDFEPTSFGACKCTLLTNSLSHQKTAQPSKNGYEE